MECIPVSYTHLDVYKRQGYLSAEAHDVYDYRLSLRYVAATVDPKYTKYKKGLNKSINICLQNKCFRKTYFNHSVSNI